NKFLDQLDYQMIHEIQELGRLDAAKIARRVGAHERTVRKRIRRLLDEEIISFRAVVNPKAFGFSIRVLIFLDVEPEFEEEVVQQFEQMPQVAFIAYGIGDCDLVLQVYFKDSDEMRAFLRRTLPSIAYIKFNGYILVPRVVRSISEWVPQLTEFHGKLDGDTLAKGDVELEAETPPVSAPAEADAVVDATNADGLEADKLENDASDAQRIGENTDVAATFIE
ncbi:MAG: AsnC family transcriptional regulator, partial [Chloroflexota bacterium]